MKSNTKSKKVESSSIEVLEDNLLYEDDENESPPADVFAYNELRSCADLYRMHKDGTLNIKPDFQREMVWKNTDQTRFIDSLTKELPIPSMCFSLDAKTQKWQVIDGLQRMSTIIQFLGDNRWKLSDLDDIDRRISGKTPLEIRKESPNVYKKVQNLALPVTVLRCDYGKPSHSEYVFTIFHRLNTGGLKLTNQEIRNAIFQGSFNDLLKECNQIESWRNLLGDTRKKNNNIDRYRKLELILRFFAFNDRSASYGGRLVSFLNEYMRDKRFASEQEIDRLRTIFNRAVSFIFDKISKKNRIEKMSGIAIDALLYGISQNIDYLEKLKPSIVPTLYRKFRKSKIFDKELSTEGILKKEKVRERLEIAKNTFFPS